MADADVALVATVAMAVIAVLSLVLVFLNRRDLNREKAAAYIDKQLAELYVPVLLFRNQVPTKSYILITKEYSDFIKLLFEKSRLAEKGTIEAFKILDNAGWIEEKIDGAKFAATYSDQAIHERLETFYEAVIKDYQYLNGEYGRLMKGRKG